MLTLAGVGAIIMYMMNQRTTNRRRVAVELAVKQSQLKRAADEASIRLAVKQKRIDSIRCHTFSLETGEPVGVLEAEYILHAQIGDPISL